MLQNLNKIRQTQSEHFGLLVIGTIIIIELTKISFVLFQYPVPVVQLGSSTKTGTLFFVSFQYPVQVFSWGAAKKQAQDEYRSSSSLMPHSSHVSNLFTLWFQKVQRYMSEFCSMPLLLQRYIHTCTYILYSSQMSFSE